MTKKQNIILIWFKNSKIFKYSYLEFGYHGYDSRQIYFYILVTSIYKKEEKGNIHLDFSY